MGEQSSNPNLMNSTSANVPIITAANFHPYNRSMKISSQNAAGVLNSTTKSSGKSGAAKFSHHHHSHVPTSIFGGSPDKATRQLKSKIPQMTL